MRFYISIFLTFVILSGFSAPPTPAAPEEEVTIIVELKEDTAPFISELKRRLPRLEVVAEYDTIFNGIAIRGTAEELEKLVRMDNVVNQYPVQTYRSLGEKPLSFTTEDIRNRIQSPYTGEGIKVGIIDTGIDYTHPDLEANYSGGFDTVDFDENPMETEGEGKTVHGTHVAGVIGANGEMEGIAPEAELFAYRALGPGGVGSSVQVIAALEEAVKQGMDVINLSLGNDVNGPDWPTTHAVNKAVELGVVVVVAAGNSGPDSWTVGSPATSSDAITVGASALSMKAPILKVPGERSKVAVQVLSGSQKWKLDKKYPIEYVGTGEKDLENVSGKIALFERGGIPFSQKALRAYKAGAKGVLIANNEKGMFYGGLDGLNLPIPVGAISQEAGKWLVEKAVQQNQWIETVQESLGDQVAPFSSRGPVTTSWEIKPDLLAPGVDIMSTVPGGYQALQGTSMAAPHVAGVAALMKEAHPDWNAEQVKNALTTSAQLIYNKETPFPPTQQGAGFIDVNKALDPEIVISAAPLSFGKADDTFFRKKLSFKVENLSDEPVQLQMERPKSENGESWTVPMTMEIPPGKSEEADVELRLNNAFLEEGIHEGYLTLKGDTDYQLPYVYVKERSDYNKVSGFELTQNWNDEKGGMYRFHLAEQVEKVTIDLYRSGTLLNIGTIAEIDQPRPGMIEGGAGLKNLDLKGAYLAVVTVNSNEGSDSYSFPVYIEGE
ncbi:S8 family serine peptidase [Halobacillus litoralis]|uniref:Peptidase n=1 Tax=Halobacillus litoralis TaxID=45668 RepID=A0A410MF64_9BACI|nr:S8 family serine peptidase [Halobacillus litoralis]QAS53305.1 peptidase [Halobacillus litoralis]